MIRIIVSIALGALLTVIHASFFSILPEPFSLIHLPLIGILANIVGFKFTDAIVMVFASGITSDLAFSTSFGSGSLALITTTMILIALFTRIFTNASTPAFIGITFVGFGIYHLLLLTGDMFSYMTEGLAFTPLISWERFGGFLLGSVMQVIAGVLAIYLLASGRRVFSKIFMFK